MGRGAAKAAAKGGSGRLRHGRCLPFTSKAQTVYPIGKLILGHAGIEPRPLQPLGIPGQRRQIVLACPDAAAPGGAEGNQSFSGKVIALQEGGDDPGCVSPPDGIVKCSPSSLSLENTGLNGLHKCVFCSF